MTPEEERKIEELFKDSGAKYYVEVMFHSKRTTEKSTCFVQLFRKGGEDFVRVDDKKIPLPEGGSLKMYWCPKCDSVILPEWHNSDIVICQNCWARIENKDLGGEAFFNCPAHILAEALSKEFAKLGHNVDLLIKYHENDMRYDPKRVTGVILKKHLDKIYEGRTFVFYPMESIIKDSINHESLTKALERALTA